MRRPSRSITLTAALILMAVIIGGIVSCRALDRSHAAKMLNIAELPASTSSIDCASYGFTDVLERCAFKIAPTDFDALLRGYQYVERCEPNVWANSDHPKENSRTSYSYGAGPVVGREFVVTFCYGAEPREFEHGGNVTVLANTSRSEVMIDLYIE